MDRNDMRYRMKIRRGMQTQDTVAQRKTIAMQTELLDLQERDHARNNRYQNSMLLESRRQTDSLDRMASALEAILAIAQAEHGKVAGIEVTFFDKETLRDLDGM